MNTLLNGEEIFVSIEKLAITHEKSLPLKVVTISLGVITSDNPSVDSHEALVKYADQALYLAKEHGRNQVRAFSELTA